MRSRFTGKNKLLTPICCHTHRITTNLKKVKICENMDYRTLNPLLVERILTKGYEETQQRVIANYAISAIKIGYLHLFHNHLHNHSENWCLAGLLNIDAYSSGVI